MRHLTTLIIMTLLSFSAGHAATPITVDSPSMQIFLPDSAKATGKAIVILPGGGYAMVAKEHEGTDWAPWFNDMGIAVAVVDYRLPAGDRSIPFGDAFEAMRYMRSHADSLNINPDDIGIMGFSAGGHLASVVATQAPADARPDFQILFYPVISMNPTLSHMGSHNNLLGSDAPETLEREFSSELRVGPTTPPAILLLSDDDRAVDPANSIAYYTALRANNISASLHIYPTGGHGWGFTSCPWKKEMLTELAAWLSR